MDIYDFIPANLWIFTFSDHSSEMDDDNDENSWLFISTVNEKKYMISFRRKLFRQIFHENFKSKIQYI